MVGISRPGDHNYNVLGDNRPTTSVKAQLQKLSDVKDPADIRHMERAKRENRVLEIGRARNPNMPKTMWDHLRDFHYHNRNLSIAAGMCGVVALSTGLGLATGWLIDELAHITDRKNDKVGLVLGLFVGFATALTQTVSLFGAARRFEFRTHALAAARDTGSIEGQCYWYIAERSPVMAAAMMRNAKSLNGEQHQNLVFCNTHVRDAMNMCIKEGWGRHVWMHSLEEYGELPLREERPYWRCTKDAPAGDFKVGNYYVSKHRSSSEFLSHENMLSFEMNETRRSDMIKSAQQAARDEKKFAGTSGFAAFKQDFAYSLESYNHASVGSRKMVDLERIKAAFNEANVGCNYDEAVQKIYDAAIKMPNVEEFDQLRKNESGLENEARTANLYLEKLIRIADPTDSAKGKSFCRVDEIEKVKMLFTGLRAPSLHTWLANLRDSLTAVMKSATSGEAQGNVAGNQVFMFIPLTIAASVVSVLCLGMSSTSPLMSSRGSGNANGNGGNGTFGQQQNSPAVGVFPSFEGGANAGSVQKQSDKTSPQQSQNANANATNSTPLMQAVNQSPNYPIAPAFSAIG